MDEDELKEMIRNHAQVVITSDRAQTAHVVSHSMLSSADNGGAALCGRGPSLGTWFGISKIGTEPNWTENWYIGITSAMKLCDKCLVQALRRGWLHE